MKAFRSKLLSAVSTLCILLLSVPAKTQAPPTQPEPRLVKFNIILTDRAGRAVDNARREDLQLLDDGNPETISYFEKEQHGVVYGLVIDGSGSLKVQFQNVVDAARQMITANQTEDETFIIKFVSSDNVRTVQELTSDRNVLTNSLAGLKVEMGQTALIDGVYLAAQNALKYQNSAGNRHLALVLVSDGEDRASYYKESDLFSLLAKGNLQVFTLGLVGQLDKDAGLIRLSVRQKATDFLTKLARETGGRAFLLNSPKELPEAIDQLTQILHVQYVIGYLPSKNADNVSRKVQVKAVASPGHEKWTVISRRVIRTKN